MQFYKWSINDMNRSIVIFFLLSMRFNPATKHWISKSNITLWYYTFFQGKASVFPLFSSLLIMKASMTALSTNFHSYWYFSFSSFAFLVLLWSACLCWRYKENSALICTLELPCSFYLLHQVDLLTWPFLDAVTTAPNVGIWKMNW